MSKAILYSGKYYNCIYIAYILIYSVTAVGKYDFRSVKSPFKSKMQDTLSNTTPKKTLLSTLMEERQH